MPATIFDTATALPRGRHQLSADEVAHSQRMRIMGALVELMAESGYPSVTIGQIATRAKVSRSAFYASFTDKQDCLFAAYDTFAETLLARMAAQLDDDHTWYEMVQAIAVEYLQALEDDLIVARAFLVEMDAAGEEARQKQRDTFDQFAEFLAERHAQFRKQETALGPLPASTFAGLTLGTRALVCNALATESTPKLTDLAPDVLYWITATIAGAAAARDRLGDIVGS